MVLASFFFAKGSPRFEKWLFGTTLYKKYVLDFMETRSVTPWVKVTLLALATVVLAVPFFMTQRLWLRIALVCALAGEYLFFLLAIKTKKSKPPRP